MKGDKKVIQYLNDALKKELGAINQYFLHSRILEDWGITKLAKHEYNESIEEMHHADELIKRILFLGGLPNLQEVAKLYIGETVKETLECDLKIELEGVTGYKEGIKYCREVDDFVTEDLFKKILAEEEGHVDYLETQLEMIQQMGLENYIQINSQSPLDTEGE
ncbi:MAG TPA: bacterioferritin [Alphaproteobacteria bacterium]|nr:bacterioferritin [Alphaproteobacteria bacterium]USO05874.1 MAG: bacterioferritin [Rhodospirillales bacterium]HOO81056.1 bacterioferritin [Alphaproteobacteria bacterium]